ncbi:FAD-dependent oxidoreductase [Leucobacter sp. Z1108]|uniref:FAD-dependent oxidoreductase n=1 Tax=Leucobacter sp. Z1108 TaxID=3439066 RepID=UPI003F2AAF6B
MGTSETRVVIVGAGHGGATTASMLRQLGFDGQVVLISDERVAPYHRPPLSKQLLSSGRDQLLFEEDFYEAQEVLLRLDSRAVRIDAEQKQVLLSDGSQLEYDQLVLATGVTANKVAALEEYPKNAFTLRTQDDAETLAEQLDRAESITIVGGGWVGLEVAAVARQAGKTVTVATRGEKILSRVASPELAECILARHREAGVEFVFGETIIGASGRDGFVRELQLSSGRRLRTELVLSGIGSQVDLQLARSAGLRVAAAIEVDADSRTSDSSIFAVGDITEREFGARGRRLQFESIPSAIEQAKRVAHVISGRPASTPETPWFWSEQYELKIQIAGVRDAADQAIVRDYSGDGRRFSVFHFVDGSLNCVESVGTQADFLVGKRLISEGVKVTPDQLADLAFDVSALLPVTDSVPVNRGDLGGTSADELPGPGGREGFALTTFVTAAGAVVSVEIEDGHTLMEGAMKQNVSGIVAECGGMATCGTCHVYVDEPWIDQLPEPEYEEEVLVEFLPLQRPNSRLACQIVACTQTDGIVIRVPGEE